MILAAGLGTRLKPLTDSVPKALLPLGGKALLEWQLLKLRDAGIREVVVNIHHFPEQIRHFCATHDFGMSIVFSDESNMLLETGGGLKKAAELLGDDQPVLVCNVDILSNIDIPSLMTAHSLNDLATLVVSQRDTQRYFLFDHEACLRGWTNVKTGEVRGHLLTSSSSSMLQMEQLTKLAFSGMHIVSPRVFKLMQSWPEKFSITDFYIEQCATETIRAFVPHNYRMMDVGKIDYLAEAEAFAESLAVN